MKIASSALALALFFTQASHAQVNESVQLKNEMTAAGIHLVGLMNYTQEELMQAIAIVGGERVLESSRTRSKIEFRTHLVIKNYSSANPEVSVDFKDGRRTLSMASAQDVADAAYSYYSQHPDPSSRSRVQYRAFDAAIKCIQIAGQGLEAITWCGFFDGSIN